MSAHFKDSEFVCPCHYATCSKDRKIHDTLIVVLETVRRHFGKPIHINSGIRCAKHNADVGGATSSQHLNAKAADIVVKDVSTREVYLWIDEIFDSLVGLGYSEEFVHIDVRGIDTPTTARWTY